jgi:uncharacterized HhH-GPD family protein
MPSRSRPRLHLSGDPDADAVLSASPLALVIGMVLDQQIPLEWAFRGPAEIQRRLGRSLDAADLAGEDLNSLEAIFREKPAIHRYPGSMAKRVQQLCIHVVDEYTGDAARIWTKATDGPDLLKRVAALPGFGEQKARIFVALLGKQLGVRADGWQKASDPYGAPGTHRSVADIVDAESLQLVRETKQAMKKAAKAKAARG